MKIRIKFFLLALIAIGLLGLTGCKIDNKHFTEPPWLGGSSIETLEKAGNYTSFLELMELANYKEPISKQLYTLFVPDDAAFDAYLAKIGKNSVSDLSEREAIQLFALHVLRNPRSRFLLIYEYVYNEFQGPDHGHNGEYMSLFHRKRTPSVTTPYTETVRYYEEHKGKDLLMTSGEKYVPLFTEEWFHDYGSSDPEGDYLFMYPESEWKKGYTSDMIGTNWHSAMVLPHENEVGELELEVRTASGFLYFIDRVIEPMPSVDEYLQKTEKYSIFYDLLQRFATYSSAGSTPDGRALYRKGYDLVYNIANEYGGSSTGPGTNFPQSIWTAFVPSNTVLQNYLDNTLLQTYPSLDSVPRITLYYLLQSHLAMSAVLMSQMEKAYFNSFGDLTDVSKSDLYPGFMGSNGVVYETKKILEPNVFTCVPGLLFKDSNYSTLLFALNKAEVLIALSNPDRDVTLFASTNEQLEEYGIRYDATKDIMEFRSPVTNQWSEMTAQELLLFAQSQIVFGEYSDFSGSGYIKTASGVYFNYTNNLIQGPENMNNEAGANFVENLPNERNGNLVKIDRPIETRYRLGQFVANNQPRYSYNDVSPYNEDVNIFYLLMKDLALINERKGDPIGTKEQWAEIKFTVSDDEWTAFIPTDDAMRKAIDEGIIPDVTVSGWKNGVSNDIIESLKNWVSYHFIKGDVIFDDGNLSGSFNTNYTYTDVDGKTTLYTKININNNPNELSILDATGNVIVVDHSKANILVKEGVVHKLDSVLKLYE